MPLALLLLLAAAPGPAPGQVDGTARPRSETAGLAAVAHAGRYGGGYGLDAVYFQPLGGGPITLSAQLGIGISGDVPRALAGGGGVAASFGWKHRALATAGWGTIGRSVLSLHGTQVADRSLYGPDAAAGYEQITQDGWVFRVLAGVSYLPRGWQESLAHFRPTFSVAVGWKIR
jgi:hypothetical protein